MQYELTGYSLQTLTARTLPDDSGDVRDITGGYDFDARTALFGQTPQLAPAPAPQMALAPGGGGAAVRRPQHNAYDLRLNLEDGPKSPRGVDGDNLV